MKEVIGKNLCIRKFIIINCYLIELDKIDWEIGNDQTSGLSIGDHTLNNAAGYFIYLDTNNAKPGEEVNKSI